MGFGHFRPLVPYIYSSTKTHGTTENGFMELDNFRNIDRLYSMTCDTHQVRNPPTTYSLKSWAIAMRLIMSHGGRARMSEKQRCCRKSLITRPKYTPKNASRTPQKHLRNARETLKALASAPPRCTQETMKIVLPNRPGLGSEASRLHKMEYFCFILYSFYYTCIVLVF